MRKISFLFLFSIIVLPLRGLEPSWGASIGNNLIDRGRYLVEQTSLCVECHTPRDQGGRLLRGHYLRGAPVPVNPPPYPHMKWALKAPAIAGLPGYDRENGIRLLMEGIARNGARLDPPMPQFRFNRADAEAIVAYLQSLK